MTNLLHQANEGQRAVTIGVRPEDVEVAASPFSGADQARVIVVEPIHG